MNSFLVLALHLLTQTKTQRAASWFTEIILHCYKLRQLPNGPYLTTTQSLTVNGDRENMAPQRVCQQLGKASKTHTHTAQTQHYHCLHTLLVEAYMHRATEQTAIKLTSACVCPTAGNCVGNQAARARYVCRKSSVQSVILSYVPGILHGTFTALKVLLIGTIYCVIWIPYCLKLTQLNCVAKFSMMNRKIGPEGQILCCH